MAIKDSAETWVRGKPIQATVLVAAVALILGGVIGAAAGFKVEQNRTQDDVAKLHAQIKAAGATGLGPLGQRVGVVTATAADSITLKTKHKGTQEVHTTAATTTEKTETTSTKDIVVGSRILITNNGSDVIVLAKDSRIGRPVLAVSSKEFQIAKANGDRGAKVPLTAVKHVDKLSSATLADIKKDSNVFAFGRETSNQVFGATEVILLQSGSGFAA